MYGYTLVKDKDMGVVKKMLPHINIKFDNDLSIVGEVTIKSVKKYKHDYVIGYYAYTCEINFKGVLVYSGNKRYGGEFYNDPACWRGNKIRMNKRFKRLVANSILNELKLFGLEGVERNLDITKINWI